MGLRGDGTEFPVEISLAPVVGSAEGLVMAVVREGWARARLDEALRETARTAAALDAITDAIVTTDVKGRVVLLNRAAEGLTGWSRDAARGRALGEVLPVKSEGGREPLDRVVHACVRSGCPGEPREAVLAVVGSSEGRSLDISTAPIHDPEGSVTGAALVVRDLTHARAIARQLTHQATHDALTGLVNRAEFERRLARAVGGAAATHAEHALCFLDLDGFKLVNDTCGHLAGDELLRQLSDLMRERMRSRDTLARLGGDEFGLLLEHCRLPTATRIADQMRSAIEAYRFTVNGQSYAVGASIGIVPIRGGGEQPGEVLQAADVACYLAKRGGGNRIQVSEPRRPRARTKTGQEWGRRISAALEENRFRLHAQAVLPLGTANGGAPRLEVLLRLDAGRREPLLPASFLPAARRHGLVTAVDRWVIRHALERLGAWRRGHAGADPPTIAVNLAEETVLAGELPALVREVLAASGVPARALCLEVAESIAVAHPAASLRLLQELRATGCRTTLEHCGSGMAAFTLLRRLPHSTTWGTPSSSPP
jgi:diguanylate cyclase (GGDEF)-like protein/PAS domain S-box-containing protein